MGLIHAFDPFNGSSGWTSQLEWSVSWERRHPCRPFAPPRRPGFQPGACGRSARMVAKIFNHGLRGWTRIRKGILGLIPIREIRGKKNSGGGWEPLAPG